MAALRPGTSTLTVHSPTVLVHTLTPCVEGSTGFVRWLTDIIEGFRDLGQRARGQGNVFEARVNVHVAWGDAARLSRCGAMAPSETTQAWFVLSEPFG